MTEKEEKKRIIGMPFIMKWTIAVIFAISSLSRLFNGKIVFALILGLMSYLWLPYFDKMTGKKFNFKITGWIKLILSLIIILILVKAGDPSTQSNISELINKNSGFTLDECNNLCEVTYTNSMQVDVCQSSCGMVSDNGKNLDKISKGIIGVYKKNK